MIKLKRLIKESAQGKHGNEAEFLNILNTKTVPLRDSIIYRGVPPREFESVQRGAFFELAIRNDRKPKDTKPIMDCFIEAYRRVYYPNLPSRRSILFCTNDYKFASEFYGSRVACVFPKKGCKLYMFDVEAARGSGYSADSIDFMTSDVWDYLFTYARIISSNLNIDDELGPNKRLVFIEKNMPVLYGFIMQAHTQYTNVDTLTNLFEKYIHALMTELTSTKDSKVPGDDYHIISMAIKCFDNADDYWSNVVEITATKIPSDSYPVEIYISGPAVYIVNSEWYLKNFQYSYNHHRFIRKKQ